MISLKKLLTEDVNYILKKSPNAIIAKAADLMAGIFRIKFKATRDEETPPNFEQDVMYVLTSSKNTQYGPASKFANGDWYYVIGDDTKSSERRLVTDVLLYPKSKVVNVDKGKQKFENIDNLFKTPPKSSGTVGSSDVIKASDFIKAIDPKAVRIPETLGTGETLINQLKEILNNTVADVPSSNDKTIIVKKDGGSVPVIDKQEDGEIKKDDIIKKDDTIKKDGEINDSGRTVITFKTTRDQHNGTQTPYATEYGLAENFYTSRLDVINDNPDAFTAEAFQQLIVQRVLLVPAYNALTAVQIFKKLKKPADGVWGDKSKNVIAQLNAAYNSTAGGNVTKELLDKLFSPLKTESRFSLKSILLEQDLTGFDPTRVTSKTPVTVTQPTKKEVPKSTTSAPKTTTPKVAISPKKEPAKTTTTPNKSLKVTMDNPYRRQIDVIANEFDLNLRWDAKLKVWYIDSRIRVILGPLMADADMTLHLRDDGTFAIWRKGTGLWIQGVNSGWSAGGRKLVVKETKWNSVHTYTSNMTDGWALLDVIYQAVEHALGQWSEYLQNVGIYTQRGSYKYINK